MPKHDILDKLSIPINNNDENKKLKEIERKFDIMMTSMETSAIIIENCVEAINSHSKKIKKINKKVKDLEDRVEFLEDEVKTKSKDLLQSMLDEANNYN